MGDEVILDLEKQILSYLLKDSKYIKDIFIDEKLDHRYFYDKDIKIIILLIQKNYDKYKTCLVFGELQKYLDEMQIEKKIEEIEAYNIASVFEEASKIGEILTDEQYQRVLDSWREAESSKKVKEVLKKSSNYITNYQGFGAIDFIKGEFEKIRTPRRLSSGISSLDINMDIDSQINDIIDRRENPDKFRGIPTGIPIFDTIFNGFENGTLTLIGGVIGTGKSTLMLNISRNQFIKYVKKILIVSLEMPDIQWARKYNSLDSQLDYTAILKGIKDKNLGISDEQITILKEKLRDRKNTKNQGDYRILSLPAKSKTWKEIELEIEQRFTGYVPDIIFVDQLSLINVSCYNVSLRREQLGECTKDIRAYAQRQKIPICVAVQANRASIERDKNGKRTININIENVEDSNQVGADADNFIALEPIDKYKLVLKTAKQREGTTDTVIVKTILSRCAIYDEMENIIPNLNKKESVIDPIKENESLINSIKRGESIKNNEDDILFSKNDNDNNYFGKFEKITNEFEKEIKIENNKKNTTSLSKEKRDKLNKEKGFLN